MPEKEKIADVKQGLATADDLRFTRYWWEVPVDEIATSREETRQGKKWVPFAKGGRPFYHDITLVVNWGNDGEEIKSYKDAAGRLMSRPQNESFYFRPGLAWAEVVSARRLETYSVPEGVICGHTAHEVYPINLEQSLRIKSLLVSSIVSEILRCLDPLSHHRPSGYVALVPVPDLRLADKLSKKAHEAHDLLREWATGGRN